MGEFKTHLQLVIDVDTTSIKLVNYEKGYVDTHAYF